ncbi:hypothetical protein L1987_43007 [Smallanthus sonchifolius]|uniref:Uncharacterized protein n=1 Tax=Smallanthus sonchifolius TaxID=185202 RepID=A0ACB9GLE0_9ASTR|nr:hypothetical protein L1987_43007 [Smallanthus sonchifolius]
MNESLKTLKGWVKMPVEEAEVLALLQCHRLKKLRKLLESSTVMSSTATEGGIVLWWAKRRRPWVVVGEVLTTRTWFMNVDNLALETLFREQGNVLEAKVVYDMESGRLRGFVFVTYNSTDEVNSAIDSLNGVDLDGRNIRVSVAEAHKCISFKKLKGVMRCNMLQYKEESDAYCEDVTTYIFYDHTDGGFMKDGFFASINVGVGWWWYTLLHRNKSEEQAYVSTWWWLRFTRK